MPKPPRLNVEITPFGPTPGAVERAVTAVVSSPAARSAIGDVDHRVLEAHLTDDGRRTTTPVPPSGIEVAIADYGNHRTFRLTADLAAPHTVEVDDSARQPHVTAAEHESAVAAIARHRVLGPALEAGHLQPYRAMPGVIPTELPDGSRKRVVAVGLVPPRRRPKGVRHEIVGVHLDTGSVERYASRAPATARATAGLCGVPVDAGQPTAARGTPGAARIRIRSGATLLWDLVAVRPAASSGASGSGLELRNVSFKGRPVLHRAHVPILNVRYDHDRCGPYRDWQWEEGMIRANGRDVAPGFRLCPMPAATIMETGSDTGNFLGVAVFVDGDEVVLTSELQAGWYRYVSTWRLHRNGQIRPRFGFAAIESSCVCNVHHHHAYWRFDFSVAGFANRVLERNGSTWRPIAYETKRLRAPGRRWRVVGPGGYGYTILPGENDRTAAGDPYAKGDLWVLRHRPGQLEDEPPPPGTEIAIDRFVNHDRVVDEDIVVWYGAHFSHDVRKHGAHHVDHVVGPTLVSHRWNEPPAL